MFKSLLVFLLKHDGTMWAKPGPTNLEKRWNRRRAAALALQLTALLQRSGNARLCWGHAYSDISGSITFKSVSVSTTLVFMCNNILLVI